MASFFYPFKLYIKHPAVWVMVGIGFALNAIMWGWLLWSIRPQPDPVFLHYTILFGVDLTGPWYKVMALPLSGLVLLVVNSALGWILFNVDRFISYFLGMTTILAHIFLMIAAWLLVFLNV